MLAHAVPTAAPPSTRLAALLADCVGELSEAARAEARSIGPDGASAVVAALLEAELASPSDDLAPLAAMYLASELRLAGALPALVSCVLHADLADDLWEAALSALYAIGSPAVESLLAAFEAHSDPDARAGLADALLAMEATDDRILNGLLQLLDQDAAKGASRLAEYGDPRALPALVEALDRAELAPLDSRDGLANEDVLDLAGAIKVLGGALNEVQRAKEQRVLRLRRRLLSEAMRLAGDEIGIKRIPASREQRPGRNDPCHCGSGKKYKKCHLEVDERERTA
jgi:hypothetical protein